MYFLTTERYSLPQVFYSFSSGFVCKEVYESHETCPTSRENDMRWRKKKFSARET